MWIFVYLGCAVLATVIIATLVCRYRVAHKKRISFGTLLVSPVVANLAVFISLGFCIGGWHFLNHDTWAALSGVFAGLGLITVMCIFPALGVVVYYQKRNKKNETPVA